MPALESPHANQLETFPNPALGRDYTIEIVCPEFTSLCPLTGQPDFGTITFRYTPGENCVELKALKLYLQRYRNQGAFYEAVVNRLLDDFVSACRRHHDHRHVCSRGGLKKRKSLVCGQETGLRVGLLFGLGDHDDGVFQPEVGQHIMHTVRCQLLDVVTARLAPQNDLLRVQLDGQIADAASGSVFDLLFQFRLQ
jgi:7-cyano-7-deazaguanine reductase